MLLMFRIGAALLESITTPTLHYDLNLVLLTILIYLLVITKEISSGMYKSWKVEILETFHLFNLGSLPDNCITVHIWRIWRNHTSGYHLYFNSHCYISIILHQAYTLIRKSTTTGRLLSYFRNQCHQKIKQTKSSFCKINPMPLPLPAVLSPWEQLLAVQSSRYNLNTKLSITIIIAL